LFHFEFADLDVLPCLLGELRECTASYAHRNHGLIAWHEHRASSKRFELDQLLVFEHKLVQILTLESRHARPEREVRSRTARRVKPSYRLQKVEHRLSRIGLIQVLAMHSPCINLFNGRRLFDF